MRQRCRIARLVRCVFSAARSWVRRFVRAAAVNGETRFMADTVQSGPPAPTRDGETRRDFLIAGRGRDRRQSAPPARPGRSSTSMNPAADTLALSSIEVDLAPVQVGQRITVAWRGQPVFIATAPPDEIKAAARRRSRDAARSPDRDAERVAEAGMADHGRRLHASGLHPARPESRPTRAAITAAGSAPATARNTIRRAASARDRRRRTWRCRRTQFTTDTAIQDRLGEHAMAATSTLRAEQAVIRWIDHRLPIFSYLEHELHDYPDAAQSELLVEFRLARRRSCW